MWLDQLQALPCASNMDPQSGSLVLLLINALLASQCDLKNQALYPEDKGSSIQDGDHFDFIVVGAGTAGSIVASGLVREEKWRVLVLEEGGIPSVSSEIPSLSLGLQKTSESTKYFTQPSENSCLSMKNGSCHWPRAKVLGGCSTINSMVYIRGNKRDFDQWSQKGNDGWNHYHTLKYFKATEKMIDPNLQKVNKYGKSGLLPLTKYKMNETLRDVILESFEEMGLQHLEEDGEIGFLESPQAIDGHVRANLAKIFLGKVNDSEKLNLATNATVTKVLIDEKDKTARGVEVKIGGRTLKVFADKEVILSAGSLNSPKLLMMSGIGPLEHLSDLGIKLIQDLNVGDNLQDHMMFPMFSKINDAAIKIKNEKERLDDIYKYFIHGEGELATVGFSNIQGFINTKKDSSYPDIQFTYVGVPKGSSFMRTYMDILNINDDIAENIVDMSKQSNILITLTILSKPKSRGRLFLKSKEPSDGVEVHTGYLSDKNGEDLETLKRGIRFAHELLKTKPFRKLDPVVLNVGIQNCEQHEFDSDEYWKCAISNIGTTLYHPSSTCKMGPILDRTAVVDSRLRVHGVNNLRVIDASIMPDIVSGNIAAATMMIGQKGAHMIIHDHDNKHVEL